MNKQFLLLWGLVLAGSLLWGQQRTVTGLVLSDDDKLPIEGATVLLKNMPKGAMTNAEGKFSIEVPDTNTVLIFSFLGMDPQEVKVGAKTYFEIALQAAKTDEVVIVGYGTQKRSQITGAVSSIQANEISSMPTLRVEQALQGRAAGVTVTQNSGSPGSALSVRVRGTGTIGNSEPLYVVDGTLVNGLDFLNPSDIESISVLKDAASAAIYGTNGANGVVLITTKRGKKDQNATVSYDSYYGIQNAWRQKDLLTAREYAILMNEAHINSGQNPPFTRIDTLGEGTDWQDSVFQAAPIYNHQFSVTGGSGKATYALSVNQFGQNGIVDGREKVYNADTTDYRWKRMDKSSFDRTTVRLNTSYEASKRLEVGNNLSFTHLQRTALPENNEFVTPVIRALNMDPLTPVRKPDGTFAFSKYSDTDILNPVNQISVTHNSWRSDRVVGNIYASYKLMDGLVFRSTANLDLTYAIQDNFTPTWNLGSAAEQSVINSVSKQFMKYRTWLWENTLTYHKVIQEKHDLTLLAGTMSQEYRFENLGGGKSVLPTNNPDAAFISMAEDQESMTVYGGAAESALRSYLGRANYEFRNKYLFAATVRVDGSSRFGANNRYAAFPSVSAGWLITREDFMPDLGALTMLKLRASWGQNGNQEIGFYGFTSTIANGLTYNFGDEQLQQNGSAAIVASNPDLKWETSTQFDLGLDAGLWDDKLTFTFDAYQKTTSNMLVTVPIPTHVGAYPPTVNAGTVRNQGIELAAQYRGNAGKLTYDVGGNIAFLSNKVVSLGSGGEPISSAYLQSASGFISRTEVGYPIASFYGYVTDGIFQNEEEVAAGGQSKAEPGDIRFKDLDGDGVITPKDQTFIGNPTPKFTGGLTGNLSYKGFDLSFFLQGVFGNDLYNGTTRWDLTYVNLPATRLDRWSGEGSTDTEPRMTLKDPNQNVRISDRFVEKGSYLRLKNLQLGYSLPLSVTGLLHVSKVRVYVASQNLFTLTKYQGLDPEIGNLGSLQIGVDRGFYPQARTFLGGINLTF